MALFTRLARSGMAALRTRESFRPQILNLSLFRIQASNARPREWECWDRMGMWKAELRASSSKKSRNEAWSGRMGLSSSTTPSNNDPRGWIISLTFSSLPKRATRDAIDSGSLSERTMAMTSPNRHRALSRLNCRPRMVR